MRTRAGSSSPNGGGTGDDGSEAAKAALAAEVRVRMDPAAQDKFVKDLESYLLCTAWYVMNGGAFSV